MRTEIGNNSSVDSISMMNLMNVFVIGGAEYVGLVTGVGPAELGHHVVNVDVVRLEKLQNGECPIYEEGLEPVTCQRANSLPRILIRRSNPTGPKDPTN